MEKLKDRMLDNIETISSIQCTKCRKIANTIGDAYDVVDFFIKNDWYCTIENVFCPKCNFKRVKSNINAKLNRSTLK